MGKKCIDHKTLMTKWEKGVQTSKFKRLKISYNMGVYIMSINTTDKIY